jgi:glucose/arabinose dehydrogenase
MKKSISMLLLLSVTYIRAQVVSTPFITGLPVPVSMHIAADGRFFISCKGYNPGYPSVVKVYSPGGVFQNDLWEFTDSTETAGEKGVIGVCTDPDFLVNHYVYVCYNHLSPASIRVVRFTESGGIGSSPQTILNLTDTYVATFHTGGNIHVRPGDPTHIYLSIGDKNVSGGAQDTTTWNGKILRIGTDGSIPTDNPFYDDGNPATGHDDRIWAMGLRNSFDFTFSALNDSLYATENGVSTYDELNILKKGKNYGWPLCEGISGSCAGYEAPVEIFGAAVPALTGIIIYTGTLMPEITNHALIVDYNNGWINDLVLGNAPYYDQLVSRTHLAGTGFMNLTDIEQGADGCIYVCEINAGKISRICDVTGVEEYAAAKQFKIYPNPASDFFTIEGKSNEVKLISMRGEVLAITKQNFLNVAQFSPGIYTVLINGLYAYKFVKE